MQISEISINNFLAEQKDNLSKEAISLVGNQDKRNEKLSEDEKRQVEELKKLDKKVKAHEAAHQSAAGGLARGTSFKYKVGPDGNKYAVAGEVKIDTSEVKDDPKATILKMQRVRRAALAPADPSPQDLKVASQASRKEAEAREELRQEQSEQIKKIDYYA